MNKFLAVSFEIVDAYSEIFENYHKYPHPKETNDMIDDNIKTYNKNIKSYFESARKKLHV